jgi:hypothetical protein
MLKNNPELMKFAAASDRGHRSGKSNTTIVLGEGSLVALKRSEADNTEAGDNGPDG